MGEDVRVGGSFTRFPWRDKRENCKARYVASLGYVGKAQTEDEETNSKSALALSVVSARLIRR